MRSRKTWRALRTETLNLATVRVQIRNPKPVILELGGMLRTAGQWADSEDAPPVQLPSACRV